MNGSNFARSVAITDTIGKMSPTNLEAWAAALQRQVLEHFAPIWGVVCTVRAASSSAPERNDEIGIHLTKVTDPGALGEHLVKPNGLPVAIVDPDLCLADGVTISSCISHELLELLADPWCHLCVQIGGAIWDREVCDRVEATSYAIDGVTVSNFNTPACFEPPDDLTGVSFDYLGVSTAPNQVLAGGYAQKLDPQQGWKQVGTMRPYRAKMAELGLSRGARRAKSMNFVTGSPVTHTAPQDADSPIRVFNAETWAKTMLANRRGIDVPSSGIYVPGEHPGDTQYRRGYSDALAEMMRRMEQS